MRMAVRSLMVVVPLLCGVSASASAQRQPLPLPPIPVLSADALAALDELSPRFAIEAALTQGWFRDRTVLYYNFGVVPAPVMPARVLWPIHGFDARGNPVAMRGQRPIFSTIPGLPGYSGLWRLEYVVVADNVQPNHLRTVASVDDLVRRGRASIRGGGTSLELNLPIVPRGSRLERDSVAGSPGWYEGREVQFFDFGVASTRPAPMWRFARGMDVDGEPVLLEGQHSILDSIPTAPTYPDLWDIRFVRVDSAYQPNSLKSAAALRSARVVVDSARVVANLPVTIVDGAPLARTPSPITVFADVRSPFPPSPTLTPRF
ncbi:MAG: hypothetical protein WD801_06165 [Gemmatimonadaceae bacterium]